tara:strand:- start:442 stop:870 length:429 start_codon:yes stop_codon:yes gene_type:complete
MSTKELEQELQADREKLEKRKKNLDERDKNIAERETRLKALEEKISRNSVKLSKMENDIKCMSAELDKREKGIKDSELKLQKEWNVLRKSLGVEDGNDHFKVFYDHLHSMYGIYVASRGDDEGLLEVIDKIIDARSKFGKSE